MLLQEARGLDVLDREQLAKRTARSSPEGSWSQWRRRSAFWQDLRYRREQRGSYTARRSRSSRSYGRRLKLVSKPVEKRLRLRSLSFVCLWSQQAQAGFSSASDSAIPQQTSDPLRSRQWIAFEIASDRSSTSLFTDHKIQATTAHPAETQAATIARELTSSLPSP